jgi:hypothetical protein
MRRCAAILAAFIAGWGVYMIAMVITVYDGILSAIFQPFMAAFCSAVFVGLAVLAGLVLKGRPIARLWNATPIWAP